MSEPGEHHLSDHHELDDKIEHIAEEVVEDIEGAMEATLPMHLRLQAWARRRPATHAVWRAVVLVVGLAALMAGLVMLVLPGPGWLFIFIGLAILASEFAWAHWAYRPVKKGYDWTLEKAKEKAGRRNQRG